MINGDKERCRDLPGIFFVLVTSVRIKDFIRKVVEET